MRQFFFLFFISILAASSHAQPSQFTLTGKLEVNTGEVFPYKLVFTESGGTIKGYSFTYNEPEETKAIITGSLDRHNHTLSFKETEIVHSHGIHTKAFMCLIDASLEHTASPQGSVITGAMNNMEADKMACTGGSIIFSNQGELRRLFEGTEKFDTVISMKRKVIIAPPPIATTPTKVTAPAVTDKITANIEKTYDWHSDSVILDIWDGGSQDGDKITLLYNNVIQLTHYLLVKEKKRLRIPLSGKGMDVITIIAENEGFEPPNTASLMLADGSIQYSVLAYNPKGQKAIIKINPVKKPAGYR